MLLSLVALIISVPVAFLNATFLLRGPEVMVLEPDTILVYRYKGVSRDVWAIAVPLTMVNTAGSYQDVQLVRGSTLDIVGSQIEFLDPPSLMTTGRDKGPADAEDGLLGRHVTEADEASNAVRPIPPGHAEQVYLRFLIGGNDNIALSRLTRHPWQLRLTTRFLRDGERRIECSVAALNREYLLKNGWQTPRCGQPQIRGNPRY